MLCFVTYVVLLVFGNKKTQIDAWVEDLCAVKAVQKRYVVGVQNLLLLQYA